MREERSALELIVAPHPQLPPLLQQLEFGMRRDQLLAQNPDLTENILLQQGYRDVALVFDFDESILVGIDLLFRMPNVLSVLEQRWGPAQRAAEHAEHVWFSPDRTLQVTLEQRADNTSLLHFRPFRAIDALFLQAHPSMPSPIDKLSFGMSENELRRLYPALDASGFSSMPEFPELRLMLLFDTSQLARVGVCFGTQNPEDALRGLWGEPALGDFAGIPQLYWFNEETGIRAVLEKGQNHTLFLSPYLSLEDLLGSESQGFAFEHTKLLGASAEQLRQAYHKTVVATHLDGSVTLHLPPTAFASRWTNLWTEADAFGAQQSYRLVLEYRNYPPFRELTLSFLVKKFGRPEPIEDALRGERWLLSSSPRVELRDDLLAGAWELTIEEQATRNEERRATESATGEP
ncbi:MAG: hypothetical protein RBU37_21795 [Myxococcota bacterium]|nr:hypothetical protein [Myxococcota bacterium]